MCARACVCLYVCVLLYMYGRITGMKIRAILAPTGLFDRRNMQCLCLIQQHTRSAWMRCSLTFVFFFVEIRTLVSSVLCAGSSAALSKLCWEKTVSSCSLLPRISAAEVSLNKTSLQSSTHSCQHQLQTICL